jgi:hypothetical protein
VTIQTTRTLVGYHSYQIGRLNIGQDGGVQAESYYLLRCGPPRIPRETDYSPWPVLALGIASGAVAVLAVVGLVDTVRWLFGIG